jgi:ech hydrogenase subunit A
VLAYSTIANLGLIVACAGIGTYEAIWAAILLIVFHAVSKSLLFLSVGTVEQLIKSREIDDMNGLILRTPKIAAMMVIGIAGMFLAPFGMLISKWAAIRAFIDAPYGFLFVIILAFGSAMTVFFWAKWMGKIIAVTSDSKNMEGEVDPSEWAALLSLAGLSLITTLVFPLLSTKLLEPFLMANYGHVAQLSQDNIIIMILMLMLLVILPLSILIPQRKHRHLAPYMGGRTTTQDMWFSGSLGVQKKTVLSSYYLYEYFGETRLRTAGIWICSALIGIMFAATALKGVIL